MRIGILTGEFPPMQGGIGAHCDILSRKLRDQNHDVFIFSGKGAKQQVADMPVTTTNGWGIMSVAAINRWIKENQLDLINLHYQTAAYNMSPIVHFLPQLIRSVPIITTFHDLRFPYLFPKAGKLRDDIVRHLAKVSTGVVVTNHEDYEQIRQLTRTTIIPIGSSILSKPENFQRDKWRKQAGITSNELLIAHFGFINHSKGVDTLLDAVFILKNQQIPVKVVMIGGRTGTADPTNADYAEQIDTIVEKLKLQDDITWTGYVTDEQVSSYLKAADVIALPFRDGASYRRSSLMAAIHNENAIITTQPSVHISSFINNENMILFPPENAAMLADALRSLYVVPQMGDSLRQGVKMLKKHFDWDTIAKQNMDFFYQVFGASV